LNQDLESRNARLFQMEQLRKDLSQMVVHDMRTPLTAVIAAMRWVERAAGPSLPAGPAEANRVGLRSAEELLHMVNELLDIARMEDGRPELHLTVVPLDALVAPAIESIGYLVTERRLQVRTELSPDLPEVRVDRAVIVRVLVNLIGNAIKFTPAGGTITVDACSPSPEWVAVTVSDTGEGIPAEYHDQIFEKFGQVASRRQGRTMSTGLGLTFCKLAVEAHGGSIGVDSHPGHGARFRFTLPTAQREMSYAP
jgi:signal transduction histidine kinase